MRHAVRWILLGSVVGLGCSTASDRDASDRSPLVTEASATSRLEATPTTAPGTATTTAATTALPPSSVVATTSATTVVPSTASTTSTIVVRTTTGEQGTPYLTMNGVELTMDVRVPPGADGRDATGSPAGRPVVVLFHGLSSATNDADDVTLVADAAAEAGMVVFSPEWLGWDPFPLLLDDVEMLRRAGECAVAFAQEQAPRFGGDPTRTVTSGFSAGTGPALTAAIEPVAGTPIEGCVASPATEPVVGTVLGDGESFWQSEQFDGAFAAEPAAMLDEVAAVIEPTGWRADPDLRIRLWAAGDRTAPRPLDDEDDWLRARDADGSIRADLAAMGALDDGVVDYVDGAALLERRAAAAGFDVELEIFPGGHTTNDKVPALVAALQTVAGDP